MKILIFIFGAFLLFYGCSEKQSVLDVSTHPTEWAERGNVNFHGSYVIENKSISCQSCHGELLDGGSSNTSCISCHALYPHNIEFSLMSSNQFHGQFIKENNWDMSACQTCHGNSFNLPSTEKSCVSCHTSPGGPTACHTCHGSLTNNAPPRDLEGNVGTDSTGVGAHQIHMGSSQFTENMNCNSCHGVEYDFYAESHIDGDDQAEITFDTLASLSGNQSYNSENLTCSNIYCHGDFTFLTDNSDYDWAYIDSSMVGNNPDVIWNVTDGSQIECGSCHGLPPSGHRLFSGQNCANCHSDVVDEDLKIIDKILHINGEINYDF